MRPLVVTFLLAAFLYGLWQLLRFDLLRLRHGTSKAEATIIAYPKNDEGRFLPLYRFREGSALRLAPVRTSRVAAHLQGSRVKVCYRKGHPRLAQQHKPFGRLFGYAVLLTLTASSANLIAADLG